MGIVCGTCGGEERCMHGSGGETCQKEATWKTQAQMGENIGMDLQEVGWGGMDWIDVSQDRDRFGAVVNTVMNLWVP